MIPAEPAAPRPESRSARTREVVHRVVREMALESFPAGDRAALRRERLESAFWKIAVRELEPAGLLPDGPNREPSLRRWAAILAILARAPGSQADGRRLGIVLAEAKIVEARVLRLARAKGESLLRTARAVAQQLANTGERVDWLDLAELILSDGSPWEDECRHRLCLDYYRSTDRAARESKKES